MNKKIFIILALLLCFASFSFAINTSGLVKRTGTNCCPQPIRTVCNDPCAGNTPPTVRIIGATPVRQTLDEKCGGCSNLAYTYGHKRWQCKQNTVTGAVESYEIAERVYADPVKAACCGVAGLREWNHSCGTRGCNSVTGRCFPLQPTVELQPQPVPQQPCVSCTIEIEENKRVCKWALLRGNFSVEVDADGKRIYGTEINCGSAGCNRNTGVCNTSSTTVSTTTSTSEKICKRGITDKTFMRYTYANGTIRDFEYRQCGSCEHCDNGECVPKPGRTSCTINVNTSTNRSNYTVSYTFEGQANTVRLNPVRNNNTGSVLGTGVTLNRRSYTNNSSRTTYYFASTAKSGHRSDYKPIYQPSSTWTCVGSTKVPVDVRGNKIWSKAEYCALGCFNGSCNKAQDMCTYNSDCPNGYRCAKLSTVNACVPERG